MCIKTIIHLFFRSPEEDYLMQAQKPKRMLDEVGSSLLKKRMLDEVGSSLLKKRMLDEVGSSLLKKRMLDEVGSSLLRKRMMNAEGSYRDPFVSMGHKRMLDEVGSSLLRKRYLDRLGSSLIKKDAEEMLGGEARPVYLPYNQKRSYSGGSVHELLGDDLAERQLDETAEGLIGRAI